VLDSENEPVPFATIALDKTKFSTTSADDGSFSLKIPAGNYSLDVYAFGFRNYERRLTIEKNTSFDIILENNEVQLEGVNVYGKSVSKTLEEGAFTVNAVDIAPNLNKMVTVNDLVDRSAGVKVRRTGGLGSDFDLTINGMSGNSIRYFIDGVPLESKGSGMTLENIPLNTVERVELYKGVVPSYLSSDALGGAVNIVTKKTRNNFLDASYAIASFHTHTGDITGQYHIPGTAIVIQPTFSVNYSKNDYKMKGVEVWSDEEDRYIYTDKKRFHDDYFSITGQIEAGVKDVKWADQFFVGASYNNLDKELQTGAMQNKVYGKARKKSNAFNLFVRFSKRWGHLAFRANISHTFDHSETMDTAFRKYSWDRTWMPSSGNEMNNGARTIMVYKRPFTVVNAGADYSLNEHHTFSLNYMFNCRRSDRHDKVNRLFEPTNDVLEKHILTLTYSQAFFEKRWQTSYFVKDYINNLHVEQKDNISITGSDLVKSNSTKNYWGAGVGSRYSFCLPVAVKASYEHSVRLPLSREMLGNGTTVYPNLTLNPETSNNYNLGLFGTWMIDDLNMLTYEANGFIRHVQNYIRATVSEREGMMQYVNEPAIHVNGLDFEVAYLWNDRLRIAVNGSWNDARDLKKYKSDGNPSATYKNRVPNRPWLFGNAEASYTFSNVFEKTDRLQIGAAFQYIHWYFLNWEAFGSISSKARIPTQNTADLSLDYSLKDGRYNISLECNNIFDHTAYDNYMLQKPGRRFAVKFRIFIN